MKTLSVISPAALKEIALAAETPSEKRGRPEKYGKFKEIIVKMVKDGHSIKNICSFIKKEDETVSEGSLSVYIFRNKLNKAAA